MWRDAKGHYQPMRATRTDYRAGLRNFFSLYRPLADTWKMIDNSNGRMVRAIASGRGSAVEYVGDPVTWVRIEREYGHGE